MRLQNLFLQWCHIFFIKTFIKNTHTHTQNHNQYNLSYYHTKPEKPCNLNKKCLCKSNSKWIMDLNAKPRSIQLLEKNNKRKPVTLGIFTYESKNIIHKGTS